MIKQHIVLKCILTAETLRRKTFSASPRLCGYPKFARAALIIYLGIFIASPQLYAQDATSLIKKIKEKIETVNSYEADGLMKTNVSFLKVPQSHVKIYFKKPDKLKIKNEAGISLVPKNILGLSLNSLLQGSFTALYTGTDIINKIPVKIIKLVPDNDTGAIVLSTLFIDENRLLILKTKIATRENGTYEMEMSYGKYADHALPDKVICTFNTKDYKLPKGVTFDYDDGSKKQSINTLPNTRGQVEIDYSSYVINKIIPDNLF